LLFTLQKDIECVGSFSDCTELEHKINSFNPDIILMDIRMPFMNGIEATRAIKKMNPDLKVIIQTVSEDEENIFNSLRAGAEGYILKSTPGEKIVQSVRDVYEGGAVITPSIALRITRFFNDQPVKEQENLLSDREKEVLKLLTEGLSYKMVAARLDISYNTVNAHIRKIYQKLSVNSVSEAVSFALKNKIV
jgi:DNA-binding NarL/FixJ family response regulator